MRLLRNIPEEYNSYLNLLSYMRPSYSVAADEFGDEFLMPVMGMPDIHGNYFCSVPDEEGYIPNLLFAAHYDTVHGDEGRQVVVVDEDHIARLPTGSSSDCLGADCTTGVWLVLEMIHANVPGYYAIFANEEVGCVGSGQFVTDNEAWMENVIDAVISFDRMDTCSIITGQSGVRTASDTFATSLASILNMPQLDADETGSFTDSNEFKDCIKECTNLSVGYKNQHTKRETQDMRYLMRLRDALIDADWSGLIFEREAGSNEDLWGYSSNWGSYASNFYRRHSVSMGTDYGLRYDVNGKLDNNGSYDFDGNWVGKREESRVSYDQHCHTYDKYGNADPNGEYDSLGNKVFSSGSSERRKLLDLIAEDPNGFVDCLIEYGVTSEKVNEYLMEQRQAAWNRHVANGYDDEVPW